MTEEPKTPETTKKSTFDFVNSINDQNYAPPEDGDQYNTYIINQAFSYFIDTIYFANEANSQGFKSNKSHYDFLFHLINKRKRRSKWFKTEKDDDLSLICEYFEVSLNRAREMLPFFNSEELEKLRQTLSTGG